MYHYHQIICFFYVLFHPGRPVLAPPFFNGLFITSSISDLWSRRWHQVVRGSVPSASHSSCSNTSLLVSPLLLTLALDFFACLIQLVPLPRRRPSSPPRSPPRTQPPSPALGAHLRRLRHVCHPARVHVRLSPLVRGQGLRSSVRPTISVSDPFLLPSPRSSFLCLPISSPVATSASSPSNPSAWPSNGSSSLSPAVRSLARWERSGCGCLSSGRGCR